MRIKSQLYPLLPLHLPTTDVQVVKVVENKVPEKVLCTAEAYPEASFMWRFNDEIIQTQVRNLVLALESNQFLLCLGSYDISLFFFSIS